MYSRFKVFLILIMVCYTNDAQIIGLTIGWFPFVGPAAEIACGVVTGNPIDVVSGVAGLGMDCLDLGFSRACSNTARLVQKGTKGVSLVRAAKTMKKAKQLNTVADRISNARNVVNAARKAKSTSGLSW
eukprot:902591_1